MSRRNKNRPKGAQSTQGVTDAVSVLDAFSNPLYRLGWGSQSPLEATEYPLTRMTDNYALLNSLYRDNWVVQNVVGLAVDDMLREWYEITGSITPAATKALAKLERKTRLRARLNEGMRWGRLYGGAAGLIMVKGQEDLSKPLDLGMIYPGSFQGLYILDRWQGITPNMGLVFDGGEEVPESYSITDGRGHTVATVHHSRVVRFTGRDLPRIERQTELYWGESEVEALYRDVVSHDNVSANMAALTFQANVNTMEVKGLEQLLSLGSPQVQRRFWQVMQAQSVLRSNFATQVVEQGTKLTNTQYSFAGLKDVYESMALNLCGASHYPMTKLFGRSPGGLNATGESDLTNYYDYIDSQREAKLRPVLERLLPVLCMSALGGIPEDVEIDFPPLKTPTPTERAEIGKTKAEAIAAAYTNGLLNVDTAQKELKKLEEETGLFGSISDEEITANAGKSYQDVTALRDPLTGLSFDTDVVDSYSAYDYSPNQPRGKDGRWIPYGAVSGSTGIKTVSFSNFKDTTEQNKAEAEKQGLGAVGASSPNGEMKTVTLYHGSYADFDKFDYEAGLKKKDGGVNYYGEGFYFTPDPQRARLYGDNIYKVQVQYSTDRRTAKRTGRDKDFQYSPDTGYWVIPADKAGNIKILEKAIAT